MDFLSNNLPISFRVLGFGEGTQVALEAIKNLGYEGYETSYENYEAAPTDNDRMVIILAPSCSEKINQIANSFYQAGVLTFIVTSNEGGWDSDCIDSLMVAPEQQWTLITKALLDPIFLPSRICYDLNDLALTLKGKGHFAIIDTTASGRDRFKDAVSNISSQLEGEIAKIEKMSMIIYFNHDIVPAIAMSELQAITDFIQTLPERLDVIWAIYMDNEMDRESIRLSLLLSGKDFTPWKND